MHTQTHYSAANASPGRGSLPGNYYSSTAEGALVLPADLPTGFFPPKEGQRALNGENGYDPDGSYNIASIDYTRMHMEKTTVVLTIHGRLPGGRPGMKSVPFFPLLTRVLLHI